MIRLVTFTDERMTISERLLYESALKHGIDDVMGYRRERLPEFFIQMAQPTINEEKGAGLYIWKPYVVFDAMRFCNDGDILIYADAGQTIIDSVLPVINGVDQDIMFFSNGWNHMDWCKMDVMETINPGKGDYKGPQVQASLIFFKVTPETRNFVKEWMLWALMPGFCDNSPSKLPNVPTFQETRWDQSILCCLQIKYGYRLHWFPTLTAYHIKAEYNDKYPAIVDHHRKRNDEW